MGNLESFKSFVKGNPQLIHHVNNGKMTWQKFYEMYDLYGENNSVWNEYINSEVKAAEAVTSGVGLASIFNWLKGINLDDVQMGINNLQRVIGVFQDFSTKDNSKPNEEYKPRPLYKHFED
jgi:hypothetical protein